jgi:transmembrane 9 superfamily protein 3
VTVYHLAEETDVVGVCGHRRGAIVTTFIVCYALTSFISGYVGGGFYSRNDGNQLLL